MAEGFVVGIDLGGTQLRVALADLAGRIVDEADEPVDPRGGLPLIERIGALAAGMLAKRVTGALRGAGLAVAGVPHPQTGAVLLAPNLPGFDTIDVRAEAARALGCAVSVENDVNMAALGEQRHGRGSDDFAFVAYGTGIGMGLVSDGRLVRGGRGAAGEIAWLPVGADPFDVRSHAHGSLETAIGSQSLLARYRERGGEAEDVRALFGAVGAGDAAAAAVVDEAARLLALGLLSVRAVADPERIVLGGSIGVRPELLDRIRHWLARAGAADLPVEASALGSRAALAGAVDLALRAACASGVE